MGRRPGSTNSPEHNDHISEAILKRYQDDPEYAEQLSQSARRRWVREYNDEVNAVLDECEAGRFQRQLIIGLRAMKRTLEDGQQLDDPQKTLLRAVRDLRKVPGMSVHDAASTPYVSETQTRHAPMTGTHTHDHAAHGSPDHDDGIHGGDGPHTHNNDADHNHPDQHPHGHGARTARASSSAQAVNGLVGSQMNSISPLERRRLKDAQLRDHEQRRGGSA